MIGYTMIGTNNFDRAAAFYDTLLGTLGAKRGMQSERFIAWFVKPGTPGISICKPHNGEAATVGNGTMVAIVVDSRDKVDTVYNKAIELGATCEGKPGERMPGFYAGYFRDLDGNKLNAFFMG